MSNWDVESVKRISKTFVSACGTVQSDEMIHYGPDRNSNIVYYFKRGTTSDQINDFLNHSLGTPHSSGKGYESLPGIQGGIYVRTQDYEGYAITLRQNVTPEERDRILLAIQSSPLIFKVFENAVPNEIILDSAIAKKEKEEREKAKSDNRPNKTAVSTSSGATP